MSDNDVIPIRRSESGPGDPYHVPGYRTNDGKDAYMDMRGRVWHAAGARRHDLPRDPLTHETIPPEFWHPRAREEYESARRLENAVLRSEIGFSDR